MTDDHLSLDELAELDEGLLGTDRAGSARSHLAGCETCRASADAITAARTALSDLPPVTMPAEVQNRIDRALADAAAVDTDDSTGSLVELERPSDTDPRVDSGPAIDTAPLPAAAPRLVDSARSSDVMPAQGTVARPRFGRPTMASSAAAAAVVLAAGAIIVAHYHHHGAATPSHLAGGPSIAGGDANPELSRSQPTSVVKSSTGLEYTTANLAARVRSVLARAPGSTPGAAPTTASGGSDTTSGATGGGSGSSAGSAGSTANSAAHPGGAGKAGRFANSSKAPLTPATAAGDALTLDDSPIPQVLQPLAHSQKRILSCAVALTGQPDAVPEHVDFARWTNDTYHNAPSAIFIFRGATAATVAVYVTNPTCSGNAIVRDFSQVSVDG